MTKRQNTHISETEKAYWVVMTSFLTKALEILHKDFGHSEFGLVRIKKSRVKDCTITFERPVNYFCDAWHVFPQVQSVDSF